MNRIKWTDKKKQELLELAKLGFSNKDIAERLGTNRNTIANARSSFRYTTKELSNLKNLDKTVYAKECFAAKSNHFGGIQCRALRITECKGCSFYKTKEQHLQDIAKAETRLTKLGGIYYGKAY